MDPNWPIPSLEEGSYVQLDYWLARFIMEIRKEDQSHYTPGRPSLFILAHKIQNQNSSDPFFKSITVIHIL